MVDERKRSVVCSESFIVYNTTTKTDLRCLCSRCQKARCVFSVPRRPRRHDLPPSVQPHGRFRPCESLAIARSVASLLP